MASDALRLLVRLPDRLVVVLVRLRLGLPEPRQGLTRDMPGLLLAGLLLVGLFFVGLFLEGVVLAALVLVRQQGILGLGHAIALPVQGRSGRSGDSGGVAVRAGTP